MRLVTRYHPLLVSLHWLLAATLGNIVGGVGIMAVLNYGQVRQE